MHRRTWTWGMVAGLVLGLHAKGALAQATPAPPGGAPPTNAPGLKPLPTLPDAPPPVVPPPPAPAPAPDVTILPPLPPATPEPPPGAPGAPGRLGTPGPAPVIPLLPEAPPTPPPPPPAPLAAAPLAVKPLSPRGFSIGLRVDVGIPLGSTVSVSASDVIPGEAGNGLGDIFGLVFPVTVDLGYRINPHWYVGAYFSAGLGTASSLCSANSSQCDQNDIRWGLEVKYLATPGGFLGATVIPWVGAGAGWEIANTANDDDATSANGPEVFHLRAGLDFRVSPHFYLGPETMFTVGMFINHLNPNPPDGEPAATVAVHDWLTFGVGSHYDF